MAVDLVTGAFGYTGSFIAERLLAGGRTVRTLTRRPSGNHRLAGQVESIPLRFDDRDSLRVAFEGIETLYFTYWRRFGDRTNGYEILLERSALLLATARDAGARVVLFSVANAGSDAPTDYFRAKARLEAMLRDLAVPGAIIRPTLLFGPGDILVNNLAWTLRRLPVVGIAGRGNYRLQTVHVEDVADLAVRLGSDRAAMGLGPDVPAIDAAGPDVLRFRDFVDLIRRAVGSRALIVPLPPAAMLLGARLLGAAIRDRVLTGDEIVELTSELLVSAAPPTCPTSFAAWITAEADRVGRRWSSEYARNYRGRPD